MPNMTPLGGPQFNNTHLDSVTYLLDFNDCAAVTAATAAATWTLDTLPAGSVILALRVKASAAFAAASLSALKLRVGGDLATDQFSPDYDIFAAGVADGTLREVFVPAMGKLSANTLTATLTATGAYLAAMTAGQVAITVLTARMMTPSTDVL